MYAPIIPALFSIFVADIVDKQESNAEYENTEVTPNTENTINNKENVTFRKLVVKNIQTKYQLIIVDYKTIL